jgi:hypothetical protein
MFYRFQRVCLVSILLISVNTSHAQIKNLSNITSQRLLLKDYALCKCLGYGFKNDSLQLKDHSLTVLTEQLYYSLETLEYIDSLMLNFADSIPLGSHSDTNGERVRRGIMLNCFEYYNSKKLDLLIRRLDKDLHFD